MPVLLKLSSSCPSYSPIRMTSLSKNGLIRQWPNFWIHFQIRSQPILYFIILCQKVDRNALRASLDGNQTFNTARYHWKYTVGQNFVPGAPLFNINSVRIDGAENFTAAQWISTIKEYKNSQLTRAEPPVIMGSS